jgi:hypothetical protein
MRMKVWGAKGEGRGARVVQVGGRGGAGGTGGAARRRRGAGARRRRAAGKTEGAREGGSETERPYAYTLLVTCLLAFQPTRVTLIAITSNNGSFEYLRGSSKASFV